MSEYAKDYTIDELMTAALARDIKDGEMCYQAAMVPLAMAAVQLARLTHAKNLMYYTHSGWDPKLYTIDELENAHRVSETSVFIPDCETIWSTFLWGQCDFEIVAPAQIDKYGNMNNNVIGDPTKPKVRLPGTVGMPDIVCYHKRTLAYEPRHEKRVFVDKVDFATVFGHVPGGVKARRALGITGGGLKLVVTNLAVLGFDDDSGLMKLISLHPGVSLRTVQENTSFDLVLPKQIPTTELPTEEQVTLIRTKIDPHGLRRHRFAA